MDSGLVSMILADAAPASQPQPWTTLPLFVGMIVIFYFVLIRPQQKKAKEHQQLLKTIKAGDKVVTSGGIIGVIISVKEKTLTLRSADAKVEITKSAVAEITERSGESSES